MQTSQQASKARDGVRRPVVSATGNHCPVSGVWAPVGEEGVCRRVLEGSVMPAFRNTATEWKLLESLQRRGLHS